MKSLLSMGALTLLAALPLVSAHTRFTTLFINDQSQGDFKCIRMDPNLSSTTSFVGFAQDPNSSEGSLSSPEMACGVAGGNAVEGACPLNAGDKITMLHRMWADGAQPGSLDPSHKGSTAVYMKKTGGAESSDPWAQQAAGDGWFKIAWNGYDEASGKWGTETMIANGGMMSAQIPSDLASGYYLVRTEALALQNVVNEHINPQFYVGCAQVLVQGSGSSEPANTVAIPGHVDSSMPAMSYNIYKSTPPTIPFQEFGPEVYTPGSASGSAPKPSSSSVPRVSASSPPKSSASSPPKTIASPPPQSIASPPPQFSSNPPPQLPASSPFKSIASPPPQSVSSRPQSIASAPPKASSSPNAGPDTTTATPYQAAVGACPSDAILQVADQCFTEIPPWSDDTAGPLPKCWAASQACWDEVDICWKIGRPAPDSAEKTEGCNLWSDKCAGIVQWCEAGNLSGPPNAGKPLRSQRPAQRVRNRRRDDAVARELTAKMLM
ncbi:hypothetical protein LTR64_003201 [Lithohypha guttulata]|nr:hypothetical protein LTR51_000577 [Lithohypha guttulata]